MMGAAGTAVIAGFVTAVMLVLVKYKWKGAIAIAAVLTIWSMIVE